MKTLNKWLCAVLVFTLVSSTPYVYAENVLQNQAVNGGVINQNIIFVDVNNHWANDAIYDMARKGIIGGYEDSSFKPEKSITREEFAKLIALTFSLNLENPGTPSYSDVTPDKWSYSYVESTKEFMTGYFPPKGKAFFSPDTKATREDVAVALVKVLGYSTADLQNANILSNQFYDAKDISYGIRDYVAIATEKKLISGYQDGTFRPENPITRAEVATLLYRVIKSSAQDQADGPELKVSMPETTENGTFYISGTTHRDAKVTINGTAISTDNGAFKEGFKLKEEGKWDVTIVAKLPSGKTTTVKKAITYKTSGPVLKLDDIAETVNVEHVTVSGTVTDVSDYNPTVYVNGKKLYVSSYGGDFSEEVKLQEGENTLTIKAKNKADKETTIIKKVTFSVGGAVLKINSIPDTTQLYSITVSGSVKDANDNNPTVYLNEKKLYVSSYSGEFSDDVKLVEGENTLTFKSENRLGKITTVVKKITFNVSGPALKVNNLPEKSMSKTITITGTVTDKNDNNPTLTINNKNVYVSSYSGSFSEDFTLDEGENSFTITATNNNGKTTTITKRIIFEIAAPVIKLNYYPVNTTLSTVTISGTATDKNDSNPTVFLNDRKIYVSGYSGSFSEDIRLQIGANPFTIVSSNSYGKTTTVTGNVYYNK